MLKLGLIDRDTALATARSEFDSVVKMTQELVRIPSRAGIDSYDPVLNFMMSWLSDHGLDFQILHSGEQPVALVSELKGGRPGPRYVLNACLDTAPFGDEHAWSVQPVSAEIRNGWLYGRGTSDSKSGASMFAHIAARLASVADRMGGSLVLLYDVDEHTGNFGGAKAFFGDPELRRDVAGMMIGYPGDRTVVIGGRGVLRLRIKVRGVSSHSGGANPTPNGIVKASQLVRALSEQRLPEEPEGEFPLSPKLTITAIEGGEGFSVTPDICTINVDIRLTPRFDATSARELVASAVRKLDKEWTGSPKSELEIVMKWPPYQLPKDSPLSSSLLNAAHECGLNPAAHVAGPSNIGNYVAGFGIPATAGFGATYRGLHATDERIKLDSIPAVHATYLRAVTNLLS